eukprot:TRINITY_DN61805_c0_g1_i2.p1 TRINITY_DN61805_c0_g1~~TRINITY_DN61805_c0_g1_i2.p1  ORF type:complete len:836 (+),score=32.79 TRINITY_DN61805_c0_g1_i2:29-2509(+)
MPFPGIALRRTPPMVVVVVACCALCVFVLDHVFRAPRGDLTTDKITCQEVHAHTFINPFGITECHEYPSEDEKRICDAKSERIAPNLLLTVFFIPYGVYDFSWYISRDLTILVAGSLLCLSFLLNDLNLIRKRPSIPKQWYNIKVYSLYTRVMFIAFSKSWPIRIAFVTIVMILFFAVRPLVILPLVIELFVRFIITPLATSFLMAQLTMLLVVFEILMVGLSWSVARSNVHSHPWDHPTVDSCRCTCIYDVDIGAQMHNPIFISLLFAVLFIIYWLLAFVPNQLRDPHLYTIRYSLPYGFTYLLNQFDLAKPIFRSTVALTRYLETREMSQGALLDVLQRLEEEIAVQERIRARMRRIMANRRRGEPLPPIHMLARRHPGRAIQRGVSQADIEGVSAARAVGQEEMGDEECAICMDGFAENGIVRTLPCFHTFHRDCIDKWLHGNKHCPICREDITGEGETEGEGGQTSSGNAGGPHHQHPHQRGISDGSPSQRNVSPHSNPTPDNSEQSAAPAQPEPGWMATSSGSPTSRLYGPGAVQMAPPPTPHPPWGEATSSPAPLTLPVSNLQQPMANKTPTGFQQQLTNPVGPYVNGGSESMLNSSSPHFLAAGPSDGNEVQQIAIGTSPPKTPPRQVGSPGSGPWITTPTTRFDHTSSTPNGVLVSRLGGNNSPVPFANVLDSPGALLTPGSGGGGKRVQILPPPPPELSHDEEYPLVPNNSTQLPGGGSPNVGMFHHTPRTYHAWLQSQRREREKQKQQTMNNTTAPVVWAEGGWSSPEPWVPANTAAVTANPSPEIGLMGHHQVTGDMLFVDRPSSPLVQGNVLYI